MKALVPSSLAYCLASLAALAAALGCAERASLPPGPVAEDLRGAYVGGEGDSLPRLRYPSGAVTLNDRCPVRKVKLNPNLRPLFVNGAPIGFC